MRIPSALLALCLALASSTTLAQDAAAHQAAEDFFAPHASNLGLLDQEHALQWVQQNTRAFGGDPSKVTIMVRTLPHRL